MEEGIVSGRVCDMAEGYLVAESILASLYVHLPLKYEDSIVVCHPGLVRVYQLVRISTFYHHSSAFYPYQWTKLAAELHVHGGLLPQILSYPLARFP